MLETQDKIQLQFFSSSACPFAYFAGKPVFTNQFRTDVEQAITQISRSSGETLITAPGRYAFSVALLASWLAGRTVVLPPDSHEVSWQRIRDQHRIGFDFDLAWSRQLSVTGAAAGHKPGKTWRVELPAMQTAALLYTSGSTRLPGVVKKSLANLFLEARCVSREFDWPSGAIVGTVPPQHMYGLTFTILLPWILGAPLVDDVPFYPKDIYTIISKTGARALISVPAHYNVLLKGEHRVKDLYCLSATAPLQEQTARQWLQANNLPITEVYGSTETGVIGFRRRLDDSRWNGFKSVRLSTNAGLLNVTSPFIHQDFGPEFQTGDHATLNGTDQFYFRGRSDSIVKIAGKRISLTGIEQAILECSGVLDAAAVAVEVQGIARDNAIWAAVVTHSPEPDMGGKIRLELGNMLEGTSIPKRFVFVDRLPRNSNGKISRKAMLELFESAEV